MIKRGEVHADKREKKRWEFRREKIRVLEVKLGKSKVNAESEESGRDREEEVEVEEGKFFEFRWGIMSWIRMGLSI